MEAANRRRGIHPAQDSASNGLSWPSATFKTYFPRVSGVPEIPRPSGWKAETPGGKETVLLVEDEKSKIDLLLTDVVMPVIGGHQLSRHLTSRFSTLKVLYMSGYTDDVIAHRGVLNQGTQLLQKPFGRAALR